MDRHRLGLRDDGGGWLVMTVLALSMAMNRGNAKPALDDDGDRSVLLRRRSITWRRGTACRARPESTTTPASKALSQDKTQDPTPI